MDSHTEQEPVCRISAPAKAILCGEHAVVYGEDAVAIGIGLHCIGQLTRTNKASSHANLLIKFQEQTQNVWISHHTSALLQQLWQTEENASYDIFIQKLQKSNNPQQGNSSIYYNSLNYKFGLFLKHYKGKYPSFADWSELSCYDYILTITSTIPIGKCLGSSAAFNTVLATAFELIFHPQFKLCYTENVQSIKEIINSLSVQFEAVEHGTPSGIDNFVSVHGGAILYNKNKQPPFKKLFKAANRIKKQLIVGLADSYVDKNTKVAVANVRKKYQTEQQYKKHIQEIGQITNEVVDLLQTKEQQWQDRFFELIQRNHELLRNLGVSHPKIEEIVERQTQQGWTAKITGSGMGGCVLLLKKAAQNLQQTDIISTTLDEDGLQIIFYQS